MFSGGLPVFFALGTLSGPGFFPLVRRQPVRFLSRKKRTMLLSNNIPAGKFCRKSLAKFTGGEKERTTQRDRKSVLHKGIVHKVPDDWGGRQRNRSGLLL